MDGERRTVHIETLVREHLLHEAAGVDGRAIVTRACASRKRTGRRNMTIALAAAAALAIGVALATLVPGRRPVRPGLPGLLRPILATGERLSESLTTIGDYGVPVETTLALVPVENPVTFARDHLGERLVDFEATFREDVHLMQGRLRSLAVEALDGTGIAL